MAGRRARDLPTVGLGRNQIVVLHLLAMNSHTIAELERSWPGITRSSARSAVDGLAGRGLVDVCDRKSGDMGRRFALTSRGVAAEREMLEDGEDPEDALHDRDTAVAP
jgi:predicted DNA-binding transcriptional regulator